MTTREETTNKCIWKKFASLLVQHNIINNTIYDQIQTFLDIHAYEFLGNSVGCHNM